MYSDRVGVRQRADIETGWVSDDMKGDGLGPNTYDLLWFRTAKGEKMHFSEVRTAILHSQCYESSCAGNTDFMNSACIAFGGLSALFFRSRQPSRLLR
jgi:hypothetical protein